MICKNCASEIGENEKVCKVCGANVEEKKEAQENEEVSENAEKSEIEVSKDASENDAQKAEDEKEQTEEEISENLSEDSAEKEAAEDKITAQENTAELMSEEKEESFALSNDKRADEQQDSIELRKKLASAKAAERQAAERNRKNSAKAKKANRLMRIITCLCAVCIVALTAVNAFTDVFDKGSADKTVVLTSLSESDRESFEQEIIKYVSLFAVGHDSEMSVADDVLDYVDPCNSNGLYRQLIGTAKEQTQESDPANRFENGYYKVEKKEMKKIYSSLGLTPIYDANSKDYYCYQDVFYFNADKSENTASLAVKAVDSKKTSEGNYYVVCDVYDNTDKNSEGEFISQPVYRRYFLVSLDKSEGANNWTVLKISSDALYNENGSKVIIGEDGQALAYVMKSKTITAKTTSGVVYAKYVIQYPYFETDGAAQLAVNTMYSQMITKYKRYAKQADKNYDRFIEAGGDKNALPKYIHIVSSVKYNENGYFSLLERKTAYDPTPKQNEDPGLLAQSEYESYTFDISGGDFLRKDEVVGKDYLAVQDILYKAFYANADEIPADTKNIGQAIYSSAWVLTKDGISFMYQNEEGALDTVTVPYKSFPDRTVF